MLRKTKQLPTAPCMTPRLRQCIKKKSKLYRMYLKGRIARGDYTYYKNRLTSVLRRVKRLYYTKLLFDSAKDQVKLWNFLNNIVERNAHQSIKEIKVGNIVLMGLLASYVNDYFVTAVSSITRDLPPSLEYIFVTPV